MVNFITFSTLSNDLYESAFHSASLTDFPLLAARPAGCQRQLLRGKDEWDRLVNPSAADTDVSHRFVVRTVALRFFFENDQLAESIDTFGRWFLGWFFGLRTFV